MSRWILAVGLLALICAGCNSSSAEEITQTDFARLKLIADQGNALAQLKLGTLYAQGKGVPQNSVEAAHCFQNAAYAGLPEAQYMLGLYYEI